MSNKILRLPMVKDRIGLSRACIYQRISKSQFPKPIKLGARAVSWLETDIQGRIDQQINESRD